MVDCASCGRPLDTSNRSPAPVQTDGGTDSGGITLCTAEDCLRDIAGREGPTPPVERYPAAEGGAQ